MRTHTKIVLLLIISLCNCVVFGNCETTREMRNGAGKILILYLKCNNTDTVRNNILALTPVNTTYMQISCIHVPIQIFQVTVSGF